MTTIRVEKPLRNNVFYEHGCLENMRKYYKAAGKCYIKQRYKAALEIVMVYTNECLT